MSPVMIPDGRWVASTRWTPSERPIAAMRTRPLTKSGSSSARSLNSSTTMTRRASRGPSKRPAARTGPVGVEVLGAGVGQEALAPAQLGSERREGASGEVLVEVGDEAQGVWEAGTLAKGRAALVVDEDEAEVVGSVVRREPGDEGLQQLGLARAGGAADERMRSVAGQVDLVRTGCREPEQGSRCTGPAAPRRLRGAPASRGSRPVARCSSRNPTLERSAMSSVVRRCVTERRELRARRSNQLESGRSGVMSSSTPAARGQRGAVATDRRPRPPPPSRPAERNGRRSRQRKASPCAGPRSSRFATPGTARSSRAPSSTTRRSGMGPARRSPVGGNREGAPADARSPMVRGATQRPLSALLGRECLPRR